VGKWTASPLINLVNYPTNLLDVCCREASIAEQERDMKQEESFISFLSLNLNLQKKAFNCAQSRLLPTVSQPAHSREQDKNKSRHGVQKRNKEKIQQQH
jgi:hypothetical protein